jgi:type II secretory pathway component PulC
VDLPELKESEPLESYSVIVQRPLFNESRLPAIEADPDANEAVEELVVADDTELEVELSGIVITPTLRIATLKRTDGSKSLVAMEGKPLEGEFGSWHLSEVQTRKVTLVSGSGKELQLELQVHDERIEPPELPVVPEKEPAASADTESAEQESSEPLSRADEIRQRIAERREQLRQQAEAEDQAGEENAQPTYEEAIRAMINRRPEPEEKPDNENEQ